MIKYAQFIEERPIVRTMIDERGREVLDKTPRKVIIPELRAPSTVMELVHSLYRQMKEQEAGVETFEDANNFDIPDELGIEMMDTPYEQDFDHLGETPGAVPASNESTPVPSPTPEPLQE